MGNGKNLLRVITTIALVLASFISINSNADFLGFGGSSDHIKVTKEVHLEKGVGIFPSSIIHTKEGGYVVVGNIGTSLAWATRVDAKGTMQWRYQLTPGAFRGSTFEGAVTLSDDSTLLCGWKGVPHPTDLMPGGKDIVGVLTHIDKAGAVLSDLVVRPKEPGEFAINYLKGCLPWKDGFAVYGDTSRFSGDPHHPPRKWELFQWILALDAAGNVKWEKLIPTSESHRETLSSFNVYVAPDQDFVLRGSRINQNGDVKNIEINEPYSEWTIRQIIAEPVGHWDIDHRNGPPKKDFSISEFRQKVEYILPNQSIVKFGSVFRGNEYIAAIEWQSPDQKQSENFKFGDSGWVSDAIPTGVPGEFVTIRQQNSDLKQSGMTLSFIQIK